MGGEAKEPGKGIKSAYGGVDEVAPVNEGGRAQEGKNQRGMGGVQKGWEEGKKEKFRKP